MFSSPVQGIMGGVALVLIDFRFFFFACTFFAASGRFSGHCIRSHGEALPQYWCEGVHAKFKKAATRVTVDRSQVFQRWALADGDGNQAKPFKTEWATIKDGSLWVGSPGLLSERSGPVPFGAYCGAKTCLEIAHASITIFIDSDGCGPVL